MPDKILFVNSTEPQCGIHQFGKRVGNTLKESNKYEFLYLTTDNWNTFIQTIMTYDIKAVIFNYYPATMPWISHHLLNQLNIPKLALFHELPITGFDYYIHLDPTFFEKDNRFTTGRPLFSYDKTFTLPSIPMIGSFGFGFHNKGYHRIVQQVQEEFDEAIIRLHIPFAHFGDQYGDSARSIGDYCKSLVHKPGVRIEVTHHFMSDEQILDFLAQNTINCFFFDNMYGRGISSSIDYALSVKRPIAITGMGWMFRHIRNISPTICIEYASLKWIIANGNTPLEPYQQMWSKENTIKDYERILDNVLK